MNWPHWAALAALGTTVLLTGCPSNTCLLTINGKCSWSTCPDGADYNTAKKTCLCQPNRVALNGGCLTYEAANQYCGKGAHFENGGCAANKCPPGLEIDQETGYCITPQQATQVASNMGVQVGQNQKLGCPKGEQLVVEGQQAACVPVQQTCGRDEVWDGQVCKKTLQCPPGSGYDPATNTCIKFASAGDSNQYTVDLPTWARTSYGPDGGDGTSAFCGAFNKHPIAFGVKAGATLRVKIALQIQAPDGQVSRASVSSAAAVDPGGQAVPAKGATEVQQAAQATLASLISSGGKSNVASTGTNVMCKVVNSSQPTAVTVSGGL
jgi:hypothetical protein